MLATKRSTCFTPEVNLETHHAQETNQSIHYRFNIQCTYHQKSKNEGTNDPKKGNNVLEF